MESIIDTLKTTGAGVSGWWLSVSGWLPEIVSIVRGEEERFKSTYKDLSESEEFKKKDCEIIGCSTDTAETHWGWLQLPKDKGGIQGVTYPLIADGNKLISDAYDVLNGEYDYNEEGELVANASMIAYRGLFLIDKEGVIQHQLVNNFPLGRNVDEAMRILEALQFHEKHGEVCPANWKPGDDGMKESHEGVADYLSSH